MWNKKTKPTMIRKESHIPAFGHPLQEQLECNFFPPRRGLDLQMANF